MLTILLLSFLAHCIKYFSDNWCEAAARQNTQRFCLFVSGYPCSVVTVWEIGILTRHQKHLPPPCNKRALPTVALDSLAKAPETVCHATEHQHAVQHCNIYM